jgi:lysophospholipase L1-like esterase
MRTSPIRAVALAVVALLAVVPGPWSHDAPARATASERWVTSWYAAPHASPAPTPQSPNPIPMTTGNRSMRQIAELTAGGSAVRLRLSNQFGSAPLTIGRTTVANRPGHGGSPSLDAATIRNVTFGGQVAVTIPVGAEIRSDPVELPVGADSDLVVTSSFPNPTATVSMHRVGANSTWAAVGDQTASGANGGWVALLSRDRLVLTGIEVRSTAEATAVFIGDSITDGNSRGLDANMRYPDRLFDRLVADCRFATVGLPNAGIAGDRLLAPGGLLDRLDRDVLQQPNVTRTLVHIGINDILTDNASAAALIAGYRELIRRAHAAGVDVYLSPITPLWSHHPSAAAEQTRTAVNAWIRSSTEFELVVDFDAALRDPVDPRLFNPVYTNDDLHPDDAGNGRMAEFIPLWAIGTKTGPCA